jgi:hypothetical protein
MFKELYYIPGMILIIALIVFIAIVAFAVGRGSVSTRKRSRAKDDME